MTPTRFLYLPSHYRVLISNVSSLQRRFKLRALLVCLFTRDIPAKLFTFASLKKRTRLRHTQHGNSTHEIHFQLKRQAFPRKPQNRPQKANREREREEDPSSFLRSPSRHNFKSSRPEFGERESRTPVYIIQWERHRQVYCVLYTAPAQSPGKRRTVQGEKEKLRCSRGRRGARVTSENRQSVGARLHLCPIPRVKSIGSRPPEKRPPVVLRYIPIYI